MWAVRNSTGNYLINHPWDFFVYDAPSIATARKFAGLGDLAAHFADLVCDSDAPIVQSLADEGITVEQISEGIAEVCMAIRTAKVNGHKAKSKRR